MALGNDQSLNIVVKLVDNATAALKSVADKVNDFNEKNKEVIQTQQKMAIGFGILSAGIAYMGKSFLQAAGSMEQTKVAFTTLLGSGERATVMMKELNDFAAKTPFEFPGITNMAQRFLAAGYSSEQIIPKLKAVGDAASAMGVGQAGADQITLALTQMSSKARLSGQEIIQLSNVGINGFKLLSEESGIAEAKLREMSEKGLLKGKESADLMAQAMSRKFSGAMEAQSQTLIGLVSTLKDNFNFLSVAVGNVFLESAKKFVSAAITVTQNVLTWVNAHAELVGIVAKSILFVVGLGTAVFGLTTAFNKAVEVVSMTMKLMAATNPIIGATFAIVTLLGVALIALSDKFGSVTNAFKLVGKSFAVIGLSIVLVFQEIGNGIMKAFNAALGFVEEKINGFIGFANKLGADLPTLSLKVDMPFDTGATKAKIQGQLAEMEKVVAGAQAEKTKRDQEQAASEKMVAEQVRISQGEMAKSSAAILQDADSKTKNAGETKKLADKHKDLSDALVKVQQTAKDELQGLEKSHSESLVSAGEKVMDLKKKLADLQGEYTKTASAQSAAFAKQQQGDAAGAGQAVVEQEKKIAELKAQISAENDAKKAAELQSQLEKEQKAYDDNAGFIKSIDGAVTEARRRDALTEFERRVEDYNARRAEAQAEYDSKRAEAAAEFAAKKAELNAELSAVMEKSKKETEEYQKKQEQITGLLAAAEALRLESTSKNAEKQIAIIDAQIEKYNQLAEAMKRASAGGATLIGGPSAASHEFGGIVSGPQGMPVPIVAHGGERVIPAGQASGMGGGINVTINNPVLKSQSDVEMVKKVLDGYFRPLLVNSKIS